LKGNNAGNLTVITQHSSSVTTIIIINHHRTVLPRFTQSLHTLRKCQEREKQNKRKERKDTRQLAGIHNID